MGLENFGEAFKEGAQAAVGIDHSLDKYNLSN